MRKVLAILLVLVMALGCFAGCGEKEPASDVDSAKFPISDTLTFVCPQNAGTEMDTIARIISKHLPKYLDGVNIVVENISGAATTVAGAQLSVEPDDVDKIILIDNFQQVVAPVLNGSVYDHTAYTPVIALSDNQNALWVNADSDIQTWEDFLAYAEKEGEVIMGTGPSGGSPYVGCATPLKEAGVNAQALIGANVPEALINLIGGRCDVAFASFALGEDYYINGDIRPIIALSNEGFDGYEGYPMDIPSTVEKGIDFTFNAVHMVCMKAGADEAKRDYFEKAIVAMYGDADFQEDWLAAGFNIVPNTGADVAVEYKQAMIDAMPGILSALDLD